MKEREKKLSQQFRKIFGSEQIEARFTDLLEWLGGGVKLPEGLEAAVQALAKLPNLFDGIEENYRHAARMAQISHHELETSSRDFITVNGNLTLINQSINALVDSLGQGFFVFDRFGTCLPFYSRACLELIEGIPVGRQLGELLRVPERERYYFDGWITLLFEGVMDFDEMAELGPKLFPHSAGRHITLEFKAIRSTSGSLEAVVVIATDRTSEREAARQAEERREFSEMILKLTRERNQLFTFVQETRRMIWLVSKYSTTFTEGDGLQEVRRLLHTIKGAASSFYIRRIKDCAHLFESELAHIETDGESPDRAGIQGKLEHYAKSLEMELNRFLAEHQQLLGLNFEKLGHTRSVPLRELYLFAEELAQFPAGDVLKRRFLESVVAVPISQLFQPFDSTMQHLATVLDRKIQILHFMGKDIRVLQEAYEGLFATLIHLFRNAVVHGIESPTERTVRGKNPLGEISVTVALLNSATPSSTESLKIQDWIDVLIEDDGKGIDVPAVREKLKQSGQYPDWETVPDEQVIQHIFDDGFSTNASINELSGRGIGLNVVRESVLALGGQISVHSTPGKGTAFRIRIPYIWSGLEKFV